MEIITTEIENKIRDLFWIDEEGKTRISLESCRLDFEKDYYFEKFTRGRIILYWLNGYDRVYIHGKIDGNKIYTENYNFAKNFK